MDNKTRNEQTRDGLNRLSADFEVELLRLIKTLNLISQSKELYKNQVDQIESISKSLQLKINDFTIKLLEIEKSVRLGQREQRNDFSTPDHSGDAEQYEILINEINDFRDSISTVNKDIERAKVEHLSKLDSYYSVYNLELKASQGELDTKLSDLKELLVSRAPDPAPEPEPEPVKELTVEPVTPPPAPEPPAAKTNGSGNGAPAEPPYEPPPIEQTTPPPAPGYAQRDTELPKKSINLTEDTFVPHKQASYSSNSVMMAIIFIFFVAIVGAGSYYLIDYISGDKTQNTLRQDVYTEEIPAPETDKSTEALIEQRQSIKKSADEPETITAQNTDAPEEIIQSEETKLTPSKPKSVITAQAPQKQTLQSASAKSDYPLTNQGPIRTQELEIKDPADSELYTVVGVGANVRSGPGINHDVSTVVLEGDQFTSLGEKRGIWIKVLTPDGTEGWISKKVVKKIN